MEPVLVSFDVIAAGFRKLSASTNNFAKNDPKICQQRSLNHQISEILIFPKLSHNIARSA